MTSNEDTSKCPGCGEPYGGRWTGIEVPGVYDGVLFWICDVCDVAWSRDWTGFGRRQEVADRHVREHNEGGARTGRA